MWVAEDVPAHMIIKGKPESFAGPSIGGGHVFTVIVHRSRKSAGVSLGHYLMAIGKRQKHRPGMYALYYAAADFFKAAGGTQGDAEPVLVIGTHAYRIRKATEGDT